MRILIVHNFYRNWGGEDASIESFETLFEGMGHEVELFTRSSKEIITVKQKIHAICSSFYSFSAYRDFKSVLCRFRPHVVFVHNLYPLISPSIFRACKRQKVKVVMSLHNYRLICPTGLLYDEGKSAICQKCCKGNTIHCFLNNCRGNRLESLHYSVLHGTHRLIGVLPKNVDTFISPSKFVGQKIREFINIRVENRFHPSSLQSPPPKDIPASADGYFLFLGRLSIEKGVLTLIDSFRSTPNLELRLIGKGPLEPTIKAKLADDCIKNVKLLGFVSREELNTNIKHATAVIVPSTWYENFPTVVQEALFFGTPIICSQIGGLQEMPKEAGIVFPAGDSESLAIICNELHKNSVRQNELKQNAVKVFKENYSIDSMRDSYRHFFTALLNKK